MDDYEVSESSGGEESSGGSQHEESSSSSQREESSGGSQHEESSGSSQHEESSSGSQHEESSGGSQHEESSGGSEASGEPAAPESPSSEGSSSVDEGDRVQDLIDAIGGLNQTITDAVSQEPEQSSAGGTGGGGDSGGSLLEEVYVAESSSVDLSPVVTVLERTNGYLKQYGELLEHQDEVLVTQHEDLLQLQANVNFIFLAVAALIGVVLGVAVANAFRELWRA